MIHRRTILLLIAGGLILLLMGLSRPSSRGTFLSGIDAVARRGEESVVSAVIELRDRFGLRRALAGVRVAFHRDGQYLGGAITDARGVASLSLPADRAGLEEIVAIASELGSRPLRASLLRLILERNDPLLVVEIDDAVASAVPFPRSLFTPYEERLPVPGAIDMLWEIDRETSIVYLPERSDRYRAATRRWLEENGLPPGPVLFPQTTLLGRLEGKLAVLRRLTQQFPRLHFGVGDDAGDARAFLDVGIRPLILGGGSGAGLLPPGATGVRGWAEVPHALRIGY